MSARVGATGEAGEGGGYAEPRAAGPLPSPLTSDKQGTWAYDTMSRRINEEILQGMVLGDNEASLSAGARERLGAFVRELENAGGEALRPVEDDGGGDADSWRAILSGLEGQTWLSAPWLITEFYFYRRILTAVGYFAGELGDPFEAQKQKGLQSSFPALEPLAKLVQGAIDDDASAVATNFKAILLTSLWGNRMDLSIWPAEATRDAESSARAKDAISEVLKSSTKMLLADDSDAVWAAIEASDGKQMDLVVDNAGFELITDLCLADFLVTRGLAEQVVIHLKTHPVFVSDAMTKDVRSHVEALAGAANVDATMRRLARRWPALLASGKWELREHPFWVLPLAFWEMPADLAAHFARSSMVFVKGDANYRRQIGERHWDFATPFEAVSSYWGAPVCCLRTMKSECACGVQPEAQARAREEDPSWLVSGRYGVVQAKTN